MKSVLQISFMHLFLRDGRMRLISLQLTIRRNPGNHV